MYKPLFRLHYRIWAQVFSSSQYDIRHGFLKQWHFLTSLYRSYQKILHSPYAYKSYKDKIKFNMYLYEYVFIFLTGATLGIIARYIAGYKKHAYIYVTLNILTGGAGCIFSALIGSLTYMQIFVSGIGGIIGQSVYVIYRLICAVLQYAWYVCDSVRLQKNKTPCKAIGDQRD